MATKIQRLSDEFVSRGIDADAALETLADRRCRSVLELLVRESESATLDEVAPALPVEGEAESHERAISRLHHVVLPKLDDSGLVSYDPDASVTELAEPSARIEKYLRRTGRYGLV